MTMTPRRTTQMLNLKKIRNLREQNFKGEANNKPLDEKDTQRSNLNKLNSCVKYPDYLICFYCVWYLYSMTYYDTKPE